MVLLVAIVIILAAVVSAITLQIADDPEETPSVVFDFESDVISFSEADSDRYNSAFENGDEVVTLTVSHGGGDTVPAEELRIIVETGDPSLDDDEFGHPQLEAEGVFTDSFGTGDSREAYLAVTGNPDGVSGASFSDQTAWSAVDVRVIHEPSNSELATERVTLPISVDGDAYAADGTLTRGDASSGEYDGPPTLLFD